MLRYFWTILVLIGHWQIGHPQSTRIQRGPEYQTLFLQLSADSLAPIFSFNTAIIDPIFIPPDLQQQTGWDHHPLDFRRMNRKIIAIPGGTGRVYSLKVTSSELEFTRSDRSQFYGYNFGAYHFLWKDTLFSFGGYGFWKHNGLLRYYDPVAGGWEITPLNTEIPASGSASHLGTWVDQHNNHLYYVARNLHHTHLLNTIQPKTYFDDTTKIYRLNLLHRKWELLGRLNSEFVALLTNALKIAELPSGELIISGPGGNRKIYLLNYSANKIFQMKDPEAAKLASLTLPGIPDKLSWYSNKILHVGPVSPDTVLHLPISSEMFSELPFHLYGSTGLTWPLLSSKAWVAILLLISCVTSIFISWLFFNKKWIASKRIADADVPIENLFNPFELSIIRGFLNHHNTLLPDDVNVILETDRKSVEVQKKYRSESIRGINEKCGKLLGTDQRLILQDRLADDRRQFIYRLNEELLELLLEKTRGLKSPK